MQKITIEDVTIPEETVIAMQSTRNAKKLVAIVKEIVVLIVNNKIEQNN